MKERQTVLSIGSLRLVLGAMAAGSVVFLVVAAVVRETGQIEESETKPMLTYLACGYAALSLVLRMVLPPLVAGAANRRDAASPVDVPPRDSGVGDDADDLAPYRGGFTVRTIMSAAIVEGAAFFAVVAYMLEGMAVSLAVAAVMVVVLLAQWPTQRRFESWAARQQ